MKKVRYRKGKLLEGFEPTKPTEDPRLIKAGEGGNTT